MTRKKKDDAKANGDQHLAAGHNKPELTEDEKRVLTYSHKAKLDGIEARLLAIKTEKRAAEDLAKSELGKGVVKDIKDLRLLEMPQGNAAMQADIERQLRLARWANAPIGQQFTFDVDRTPEVERAFELGKTAGLKGEPKKPPYDHSVPQHDSWCHGWDTGYEICLSDFRSKIKPLNEKSPVEQMDLAERPDLPPAQPFVPPDTSDAPFAPPSDGLDIPENLRRTDIPASPQQPQ